MCKIYFHSFFKETIQIFVVHALYCKLYRKFTFLHFLLFLNLFLNENNFTVKQISAAALTHAKRVCQTINALVASIAISVVAWTRKRMSVSNCWMFIFCWRWISLIYELMTDQLEKWWNGNASDGRAWEISIILLIWAKHVGESS